MTNINFSAIAFTFTFVLIFLYNTVSIYNNREKIRANEGTIMPAIFREARWLLLMVAILLIRHS
jgi:cbb3-type cytochrome oxidase subunit 3